MKLLATMTCAQATTPVFVVVTPNIVISVVIVVTLTGILITLVAPGVVIVRKPALVTPELIAIVMRGVWRERPRRKPVRKMKHVLRSAPV